MSYNTSEDAALFEKNEVNDASLPHDEMERNIFLDENFEAVEK